MAISTKSTSRNIGGGSLSVSTSTDDSLWQDASTSLTRRCVLMEVYGDTGTGRTTFALSAPGPIALIHAAEKLEGIVQQFTRQGKVVRLANFGAVFSGSDDEVANQANKVWTRLLTAYYDAYSWARTIIIDTHTEAWELLRLARFGDVKPSGGRVDSNYGPVNAEWRSIFKYFRQQSELSPTTCPNLIVIGQTKDEYAKGKRNAQTGKEGMGERTGNTIRAGQKEVGYMSDVVVRTERDIFNGNRFIAKVDKEWWNGAMRGVDLEGVDFPTFMGVLTETDPEQWSK